MSCKLLLRCWFCGARCRTSPAFFGSANWAQSLRYTGMSRSRSTLPTRGLRRLLLALHTLQQSVGRLVNAAPRSGVIAMPAPMLRTQSPPSGEFDYSKLEWAYDTRWGGCEAARIPLDRIQDLLAGERRRGACDLVLTHTDAANESSGSRAPAEGKLAKKTYLHCTHGPEDESEPSGALATSTPPRSGPGSRPNSKRQTGASIKRGCQVKFMWAPLAADSGCCCGTQPPQHVS